MKTKLFFGMLTAAATLAVTPAVFADEATAGSVTGSTNNGSGDTYTTDTGSTVIGTVSKNYVRSITSGSWTSASITTTGTVGGYKIKITGATDADGNVTTDQDLYFTGTSEDHTDSLTITELVVENGSANGYYSTRKAFIVEGTTVILDGEGVNVTELGMNLCIGTEYGVGDATLIISGGAQVTTGAVYSTVGSNLATGTITITGENSLLATQQITLGGGVNSLFPTETPVAGEYQTKCFVDTDTYNDYIRDVLVSATFDPTSGSYGIVNVEKGGTWTVGVGNKDLSNSRLQLANGEVNIDGGSLIFGTSSSLTMCNESLFTNSGSEYGIYTEMNVSEKVTVTNGGTVSVETDAAGNAQTMAQLVVGETYIGENVVAEISVDGEGSSFVISAQQVYIGSDSGYYTSGYVGTYNVEGGSSTAKILATDGGVIDIFAAVDPLIICADNYASYIGSMSENVIMKGAKSSHGLDVEIKASLGEGENGSTISLGSEQLVLLGGGSPAEGYENNIAITADGKGSSVSISGTSIYANYGTNGTDASEHVHVTFTASNGGAINLTANGDGAGDGIALNKNTSVIVEKGSSLTTVGAVLFNTDSSISVDGTSKWAGENVEFASGSSLSITAGASAITTLDGGASANVSLGAVTIAEGASITVTIDISSLDNYTSASVAILTADSIVFDYVANTSGTTLTDSNVGEFAESYITADENGYTIESWLWVSDGTDNGGTLYANIRTMPEPSMFGMLFGLSALGLVSTRRRRRKA